MKKIIIILLELFSPAISQIWFFICFVIFIFLIGAEIHLILKLLLISLLIFIVDKSVRFQERVKRKINEKEDNSIKK